MSRAKAHATLHAEYPAWEELAMLSLRRITVVNQPRARAAVLSRLASLLGQHRKLATNHARRSPLSSPALDCAAPSSIHPRCVGSAGSLTGL